MRDIVLAGIPRSGTTLACVLLNRAPNTVALNEPFEVSQLATREKPQAKVDWLKERFAAARTNLLQEGRELSKGKEGRLVSNIFLEKSSEDGLRQDIASLQPIPFPGLTTVDFTLVVKHPNAFTVLLPLLNDHFECFAVVRNPLAVLLSWNSTKARWREGYVPMAEKLDARLRAGLSEIESARDRQHFILSHYFRIIRTTLPATHVVRYEDMVRTGGGVLDKIAPEAQGLARPLLNFNTNPVYRRQDEEPLQRQLLSRSPFWEPFYSDEEIAGLARSLREP